MTAGSPRVAMTTPVPPAPPAPAPIAAPLPPPAIAPIAAPMPAPIPIFMASFFVELFACLVHEFVAISIFRPSASVSFSNLTLITATPLTRPPGSALTIVPSTGAPFFAMTQSPSVIARARLAVNVWPLRLFFVERSFSVNMEITLPDSIVNVRGGAGLSATGAGDLGGDFSALSLFDEPTAGFLADSPVDTAGVSATVGEGDASVVGLGEAVGWLDAVFGDDEQLN